MSFRQIRKLIGAAGGYMDEVVDAVLLISNWGKMPRQDWIAECVDLIYDGIAEVLGREPTQRVDAENLARSVDEIICSVEAIMSRERGKSGQEGGNV
jgi:hypothetical protein